MRTYLTNECSFELEEAFADHTVHALQARIDDDVDVGLWLSRELLPDGRTLRDAVSACVAERGSRLDDYRVLDEREGEVAGVRVIELSARFRDGDVVVHERQAHFTASRVWYCLWARADFGQRAVCDRVIDHVLPTLRFREAD